MPWGKMPMIATSAKPMIPIAMAISIIVKPRCDRRWDLTVGCDSVEP
jgi:hypothetical protein